MDTINWLNSNEKYFSESLNGYPCVPLGPYLSTLPLVDLDGKVMDLGCGNGMLLKFLMKFSGHDLIPYGVDKEFTPIRQVKFAILPEYKDNFSVNTVDRYKFKEKFDLIISNPFYSKDMKKFTSDCLEALNPGGKLIYRIHDDVLRNNDINSLDDVSELNDYNLKNSKGLRIVFGVINK